MKFNFINKDKKNDIEVNINKIISDLDIFFDSKISQKLISNISKNYNIPKNEVIFFFKKRITNLLNFSNKKKEAYDAKLKPINIIKYIFYCFFHCVYIFLFRKKLNKCKYFNILIDHIDSANELKHYSRIIDGFETDEILIRTRINNLADNKKNIYFIPRYKNYNFSLKDFGRYLLLLSLSTLASFKSNLNFNYLILKLVDEIFFYKTFFSNYKIKNIIMHQHYYSSNIKDYFFKKNNGNLSCLIQKNLSTKNSSGYFYHCDTLFTYSNNAKINSSKSRSKINNIFPVGSIFMERHFFNESENYVPEIDILLIAGTGLSPGRHYDTYEKYTHDYNEHLNWIINIANDFPNLKVGIKHRWNNKDPYEYDYLKNSKISIVDQNLNSYHVASKAKFLCSWCSSMIVELNSIGKFGMFLDPGGRNNQFLRDLNFREKISLRSYEEFKNLILKTDLNNYSNEISEFYCLKSKDVSSKIINYLKRK